MLRTHIYSSDLLYFRSSLENPRFNTKPIFKRNILYYLKTNFFDKIQFKKKETLRTP